VDPQLEDSNMCCHHGPGDYPEKSGGSRIIGLYRRRRKFEVIVSQQAAAGRLGRLAIEAALGFCLLSAGLQVHARNASSLNLAVGDVFPVTRSDLGFSDGPHALLLAQASSASGKAAAWDAVPPSTDKFDWLRTTSGEWLKGELRVLYSGSLEFDSAEFGLQTLDWDDVAQYFGHGHKRVRFDAPGGPVTVDGVIRITEDKVIVETAGGTREFDRSLLISITRGAVKEVDNWFAKISFGLNFSRGNTDQTDITAKFDVRRRTPNNRFVLTYLGNFSAVAQRQTVNNHRINTFFDIFAKKSYFWRPVFAEYYRDPFQNIDQRGTLGFGGGYHIIDTPKTTWDVSGGPAYRATRFVSVEPGDSQKVTTPALVATTYYDTPLTKIVDFNALYQFNLVNQVSGTYTHHAIATFEIELTRILDFDISFVWDRTQKPQARSDGSIPDQDDLQLLLTLGVEI
jgi:hypothetical protein